MSDTEWGEAHICHRCVQDPILQKMIRSDGKRLTCTFCKSRRLSVPLAEVAAPIDEFHRTYHRLGEPMSGGQHGEYPEWIVIGLAGCEPVVAEAIVEFLSDQENHDVHHDGADAMWDTTTKYDSIAIYPYVLHDLWQSFRDRIRQVRRYFDPEAHDTLREVIGDTALLQDVTDRPVVVTLKKGMRVPALYRARVVDSRESADAIAEEAPASVGPPPHGEARAGRMNAAGIQVFYGGFSREVCVAEVRPVIGSYVVVSEFIPTRDLRLLDLTSFVNSWPQISPFATDYHDVVSRWEFLEDFDEMISLPILPEDEATDYVPTQAVSEFVGHEMKFDGMVFTSAQYSGSNEAARNFVLFPDGRSQPESSDIDAFGLSWVAESITIRKVVGMSITTEPPLDFDQ